MPSPAAPALHLLVCVLLVSGCAGADLRPEQPPPDPLRLDLDDLSWREYWTGLALNGSKIGYSHLRLAPAPGGGAAYEIQSEAVMRFHLLATDKQVNLAAADRVGPDLRLIDFDYDYNLDDNRLSLQGRVSEGKLVVQVRSSAGRMREEHVLGGPLYPASAMGLYPLLRGLAVGRRYQYLVYSGETRTVEPVVQEVVGYERSPLFEGPAYKLRTRLREQEVSTWVDAEGRPLLERSLGGVIVSALESEQRARRYVAQAALSKEETLLEFTLVRTAEPLPDPRRIGAMDIVLSGVPAALAPPQGAGQHCAREGQALRCSLGVAARGEPLEPAAYLHDSLAVPSRHTVITELAEAIAGQVSGEAERAAALVQWLRTHIEREAVDAFSALDVLERGRAECQGHTYLYTALARALGIPTRVVNGLVYSMAHEGFLYHTWAQSLLDGRWVSVDPTFGQIPADATHVALIEGERLSELAPLTSMVGRVQARITSITHRRLAGEPNAPAGPAD